MFRGAWQRKADIEDDENVRGRRASEKAMFHKSCGASVVKKHEWCRDFSILFYLSFSSLSLFCTV